VSANVVDSSGWLEYLADSHRAPLFAAAIEDSGNWVVPVITVYEVFRKVLRERGEDAALQVASLILNPHVKGFSAHGSGHGRGWSGQRMDPKDPIRSPSPKSPGIPMRGNDALAPLKHGPHGIPCAKPKVSQQVAGG